MKMNEVLKNINVEQNNKIESLINQLNNFKNSITDEFKEIRDRGRDSHSRRANHLTKQETFRPTIENIQSLEITTPKNQENDEKKKQEEKRLKNERKKEAYKKQTKPFFNAGPLESDNEDDLVINKQNNSINIKPTTFKKDDSIKIDKSEDAKFSFAPSLKNSAVKNEISPFTNISLEIKNSNADFVNRESLKRPTSSASKKSKQQEENDKKHSRSPSPKEVVKEITDVEVQMTRPEIKEVAQERQETYETQTKITKTISDEDLKNKLESFYHNFYDRDNQTYNQPSISTYTKQLMYKFYLF